MLARQSGQGFAAFGLGSVPPNLSARLVDNAQDGVLRCYYLARPKLVRDILATLGHLADRRPQLVVGFAAETHDILEYAQGKRVSKGCDWIVANDVSPGTGIMGGDENAVVLITADGAEDWPRLPKDEVARRLAARIADALGAG